MKGWHPSKGVLDEAAAFPAGDFVSKALLIQICDMLGLDANNVQEIRIKPDKVIVRFYARDEKGSMIIDETGVKPKTYDQIMRVL